MLGPSGRGTHVSTSVGHGRHVSMLTLGPSGCGTHVRAPTPGPSGRGTHVSASVGHGRHSSAPTPGSSGSQTHVSVPMQGSSASGKTPAIPPRPEPTGEHGAFSSGARLPCPRCHQRVTDSRHTLSADGTAAPAVSSSSQPLLHNQRPTLQGLPVTQVRDLL